MTFTRQFVAELSLVGMGLDILGGCYLAYDLLGGKHGPLRTIARATGYVALFFIGYAVVLGFKYAAVAATGMGISLAIEFRYAAMSQGESQKHRGLQLLFGFLRGLVLGLAGATIAGLSFGAVFGVLSGIGLTISYALGYAPTRDYETKSRPHLSKHKILASFFRAIAVSVAGLAAGFISMPVTHWVVFGLKLGLAAGTVSALATLLSPVIEWQIENLPERRLGFFGLILILFGVVFQSVQYWIVVFDLSVQ